MASVESLRARHDAILAMYEQRRGEVVEVQRHALQDLLPVLQDELELQEVDMIRARAFLEDPVTVFRFCRRARFSLPAALKLLHATLEWRLSSLPLLSPSSVSPLYLTHPLFFFHSDLSDRFGRPCAVLNLRHAKRTDDGELDALKDFIRLSWETGRRWLSDLSKERKDTDTEVALQMVLIVDLGGAGMSNLEVELLPFFMDLLKKHFPSMVGAIFVLNYGWMYSGMWQLVKRVLPQTALDRILFPSNAELLQFFDEEHLLVEHGGKVVYEYTPSNPILNTYGRPFPAAASSYPSPLPSPSPSRSPSSEAIDELFHSAPGTPSRSHPSTPGSAAPSLSRRPSGLGMTSLKSARGSATDLIQHGGILSRWRQPAAEGERTMRRVASFADLQDRLAEMQAAIESDSSGEDEGSMVMEQDDEFYAREAAAREYARFVAGSKADDEGETEDTEGEREGRSGPTSAGTSALSSMAPSRSHSQAASRDGSPLRRHNGETFSSRAVRFSGPNHISPYNHSNPYYGYPAFVPSTSLDPSGVPRPHFHRRRKRDLVRTLTYLAVLRFLALHRNIKWQLSVVLRAVLRLTGLRRLPWSEKEKERSTPKVRWGETASPHSQSERGRRGKVGEVSRWATVDVRLVYALLVFIAVRSEVVQGLARKVIVDLPRRVLSERILERAAGVVPVVVSAGAGRGRKRDFVKVLLGFRGK